MVQKMYGAKRKMDESKIVEKKYNRLSAVYDIIEWPFERLWFAKWRKRICSEAAGKVLEVGIGTGKNLRYYPEKAKLTGIDISRGMLNKAIKKSKILKKECSLLLMNAEDMKFDDNSFDTVLCTFILCSVPDPVKTLKEMRRVCRPNGKILMMEHVLSKYRLMALWQDIHAPLIRWVSGVNINRDTAGNIRKAGLEITAEENLALKDVFKYFVCSANKGGKNEKMD